MNVGALLFRWRLAVIVGAFGAAAGLATLDLGASLTDLVGLERAFLLTGPLCLVALLLRVTGEARLGAAVYGQEASARVVTGGPFRFSRHPLYVGTWLFFVAATAPYLSPLVLAALALFFALALASIGAHEERALEDKHGDAWRAYARAVPRFLGVPRGVPDDGLAPGARAYTSAIAGNLFFLSLGLYRIALGALGPGGSDTRAAKLLGLMNLACLGVWLLVVLLRRLRARNVTHEQAPT